MEEVLQFLCRVTDQLGISQQNLARCVLVLIVFAAGYFVGRYEFFKCADFLFGKASREPRKIHPWDRYKGGWRCMYLGFTPKKTPLTDLIEFLAEISSSGELVADDGQDRSAEEGQQVRTDLREQKASFLFIGKDLDA